MYIYDHTALCRPTPTSKICSGDASFLFLLAKLISVCVHMLKTIRKKCADYLAVWENRVNTHTHTHTFSRAYFIDYLLNIKALVKAFFCFSARFTPRQHLSHHIPPPDFPMEEFAIAYGGPCCMSIIQRVTVVRFVPHRIN